MRCLICQGIVTDRDVEVNDGCCPYCGAAEFEEDVTDEETYPETEEEFGNFEDDEEEDELKGYDFSDIELDDDEDDFFGDDDEFEEDDFGIDEEGEEDDYER